MKSWSSRLGILFSGISAAAWVLNFVRYVVIGMPLVDILLNPILLSEFFLTLGFFFSARYPRFAWFQPVVMLIVTAFPFMDKEQGNTTMYGLGLFVIAVFILYKSGFYETRRITKVILSLAYLYGLEIFAALRNTRSLFYAFTPVFFITMFLILLYIMFNERVIVYLKEPKPKLSLDEKGLSIAEKSYIRALIAGQSPKEIAVAYSISESTVRNTLSRAYKKLGVENKNALTQLAERHEILE